jgi:hypothetical protein
MSPFHPTKRDLLLVFSSFLILALLLQFDFSLRLGYGQPSGRSYRDVADRACTARQDKFLEDVVNGAKSTEGRLIPGMTESKVRWGEEGAVRTEVLAHAPGMSLLSLYQAPPSLTRRMDHLRPAVPVQRDLVHRDG